MDRPGIPTGALVGAFVSASLIAILYVAQQIAGLPFVPYDVFDWTARVLPGALITFGIDTMVSVIRALNVGDLSAVAKTAEQSLAIGGLWLTGIAAGAVLFGILRRRGAGSRGATGAGVGAAAVRAAGPDAVRPPTGVRPGLAVGAGLIVGAVIGVPAMLISIARSVTATVGVAAGAVWVLAVFLAWGAVLGWTYARLSALPAAARAPSDTPGPQSGTQPRAQPAARPDAQRGPTLRPLDRRRFLVRLGGASAVITVAGAGMGAVVGMRRELEAMRARGAPWSARNPLPNADAGVGPVAGTRAELTPVEDHYRIDINLRPPEVTAARWRLRFGGLVERPAALTLDELRERYEPMHQFITLACISNPVGGDLTSTQRWTGVSLRRLLEEVGPEPEATHLRIRSVDDFHETLALDAVRADPRIMLTYAWDGLPLPTEHGFPLRIYIPDRYGMKQPKWIESIEAVPAFEPGYWVRRGWDREARMRATSVIDVVASNMMVIEADERDGANGSEAGGPQGGAQQGAADEGMRVPLGGIAHAGARGISRVEVRVDDGPWQPARLREPLSDLSWVLWRFDWPFEPGDHTFTVRCYDGNGTPQVAERSPVRPDGATGLDSEGAML